VVTQNSTRVVNVRSIALVFAALVLLMAGILAVNWFAATSLTRSVTPTQSVPAGGSSVPSNGPARPQHPF
jgi:hypothetical protein